MLEHNELLARSGYVLEIAPWRALSHWIRTQPGVQFIGLDRALANTAVTLLGDAENIPLQDNCCELAFSVHVLEHVHDDRKAIAEMFRVLRGGGHAIVSAPLQFEKPTMEDPTVTDPAERKRLYGEEEHLRFYGLDLRDRLAAAGFQVELDLAENLSEETCVRYGLRRDENIFLCQKPEAA